MRIRKAKREDFEDYYKLKKEEEKEYPEIIQEKVPTLSKREYKKDFDEIFSSRNNLLIIIEEKESMVGFLYGRMYRSRKNSKGYIEVIFISKEFRRKGLARNLIRRFTEILKGKRYNKIQLSVNQKNIGAVKLYKRLGFKILKYEMEKSL